MMDIDHYSENYWYSLYRRLKETHHYATHRKIRRMMKSIRREAALERQIAAQQRQHTADQRRIAELETKHKEAQHFISSIMTHCDYDGTINDGTRININKAERITAK